MSAPASEAKFQATIGEVEALAASVLSGPPGDHRTDVIGLMQSGRERNLLEAGLPARQCPCARKRRARDGNRFAMAETPPRETRNLFGCNLTARLVPSAQNRCASAQKRPVMTETPPQPMSTDSFPVSTRKTSSPDFKSEMAKGCGGSTSSATPHGCGAAISPFETEQPRVAKVPISNRTLGSIEGAPVLDATVENPAANTSGFNPDVLLPEKENLAPWAMPTATFRARQAFLAMSPAERAALAARVRFYSMAWLHPADDPDDLLP